MDGQEAAIEGRRDPEDEARSDAPPRVGPRPRIAVVMFADIRGFTRYTSEHGADAAAALADRFVGLAKEVVEAHDGEVQGVWGDEVLTEFGSARDAARAAVALQDRCGAQSLADPANPLPVGIGLDVGESTASTHTSSGSALNLASRLCGAAHPGESLATREVSHLAGTVDGIAFEPSGKLHLKGISGATEVVRLRSLARTAETDRAIRELLQPAPPPRRPLLRTVVAALLVIALVVGAGWWWRARRTTPPPTIAGQSVAKIDLGSGALLADAAVGRQPSAVAVDGDTVWVANTGSDTLSKVDAHTGAVVDTVPVSDDAVSQGPVALAVVGGDVWVVNSLAGSVTEISVQTDKAVASIPVGATPSAITYGFGYLWVTDEGDGQVTRIDPRTAVADTPIDVGDAPDGIAAGHGALWVSARADNAVVRLDPISLQVGTSIRVGSGPRGIVADDTGVWVADSLGGTVAHIDPSTGEMDRQLPVGDTPTSIVSGGGSVWVSNAGDNTIARIDSVAQLVKERLSVGSSPRGLGISGGALWVAAQPGRSPAHVGGTLRVAYPGGFTTIDPAVDYDTEGWQAMHYVYDGLVGLNRGGGSANYEVVPDLARALPTVSPDGKTYTFTLRNGIEYSDGTPLRASDILRGVRRVLTVRGEQPVEYYDHIVGAQQCVKAPTTCDLSRGVEPRDDAGTVTFHLTAPDPDFLYKLTIFVVATPPGALDRDFGTDAFPGTGPYQVQRFEKGSTLTLIRNMHFQQWSSAAQPEGYPDVLTWVSTESQTAATDSVARGVDDVASTSYADALRLTRTLPTQVLTVSVPESYFIVLAGDSPPFNTTLARQAVAMAVDRRTIAPLLARGLPQCRLVPPSYPGYSSGCPYKYDPARAKVIAAQSGTTRYPVHIYIEKDQQSRNFFDAFVGVQQTIAGLGYRTTLTPLPSFDAYNSVVANPDSHVNAYGRGWTADYPSPSQFYQILSCATTGTNFPRHCDQALDRLAARAVAKQATDPAAAGREWKALYQQVDKDAYVIAYSGGIASYLVSARVGNAYVEGFLNEPEYDQMWVR